MVRKESSLLGDLIDKSSLVEWFVVGCETNSNQCLSHATGLFF